MATKSTQLSSDGAKTPSSGGDNKPEDPDKPVSSGQSSKRNRNRRNKKKPTGSTPAWSQSKFTGRCDDLEGFVYDLGPNQADMYIKTTKELYQYVGKKYTMEVRMSIEKLQPHPFTEPPMPKTKDVTSGLMRDKVEAEMSYIEKKKLDIKIRAFVNEETQYNKDMHQTFSIIEGQCSDAMIQKMKSDAAFEAAQKTCNPIGLLKIIKTICYSCQSEQFTLLSIVQSMLRFVTLRQGPREANVDYLERFNNSLTVFTSCGGTICFPGALKYVAKQKYGFAYETLTLDQKKTIRPLATEAVAAILYLENAGDRYASLRKELANDYLKATNNYPSDLVSAQSFLLNYKGEASKEPKVTASNDLLFSQQGTTTTKGTTPQQSTRDMSKVICRDCGSEGHYPHSYDCPIQKQLREDSDKLKAIESANASKGKESTKPPPIATAEQVLMMGTESDPTMELGSGPQVMFCQIGQSVGKLDSSPHEDAFTHRGARNVTHHTWSDAVLSQAPGSINKDWCLLDSQSTCNVFVNPRYLTNIRMAPGGQEMHIHCNAGTVICRTIGELSGFGTVWYHPTGIANVLSLAKVQKIFRVTYDSTEGNCFEVHSPRNPRFTMSAAGLYYLDMRKQNVQRDHLLAEQGEELTPMERGGSGIRTVEKNKSKYSTRDVARANEARRFQEITGTSLAKLLRIVDKKLLPNCPVTREDVKMAEDIYGPSIAHLKGKTVRRKTDHIHTEITPIPPDIKSKYRSITLCGDIIFINGIRFLITISRHIRFATGIQLPDAKIETLFSSIQAVNSIYRKRGFEVNALHMDGQFEPLRAKTAEMGITLDVVSNDVHVPEIERFNRVLKERVRSSKATTPFKKLPARFLIELVAACIFWWNAFPANGGISTTMSPRMIITGSDIDYNRHCKLQPGEYVQTHEDTDNTMKYRTVGALALRPTGNAQGGYYYMSLKTGRRINRAYCTPLPMPSEAIDRVHELAKDGPEGLTFCDRNNIPTPDSVDLPNEDIYDEISDSGSDIDDTPSQGEESSDSESYVSDDGVMPDENDSDTDGDASEISEIEGVSADEPNDTDENIHHQDERSDSVNDQPPARQSLRNRPKVNYRDMSKAKHLKTVGYSSVLSGATALIDTTLRTYCNVANAIKHYNDPRVFETIVNHTILSQYGLKKGLALFGEPGEQAVIKELQQLHDRHVLSPKLPRELTPTERERALSYLMFLKMKSSGEIKGRGCADGRKQRDYMTKEDTSSPTVSTEALILSCMIDAMEGRDVATADIPGAFLQTDYTKGDTHLRLEGEMVTLLEKIDPGYSKYVFTNKKGKKILYAETMKAIYGTLNASLLFWIKLSASLTKMGFEVNPYDWCCMNKMTNGKQCTILWHVDDIKISHVDPTVVTSILKQINDEYGKVSPLTETRGKVHEYLGMTIDFSNPGKVMFTMFPYIQNMLNDLPEDMQGEAVTPAAHHLFAINDDQPDHLSKTDAEMFHSNVAMLLYLSKRARPDIQLPVAFLCTRVQHPDTDDYKKLTRVMKYLRATIGLPLILGIDGRGGVKWYVDAAFAVHRDMRSHTGAMMTMGTGAAHCVSSKQKINTKSSTEAEFVGVDDIMGQVLWARYFLLAQGYDLEENIVYQDNQSAMKLEKNGMRSSSRRTRHINIRYYFVTDRVSAKELSIEYCPTLEMIGDYFTKPLQGSLFRGFRNAILGISEDDIPHYNAKARAMIEPTTCE
jgi:hypothetical protein